MSSSKSLKSAAPAAAQTASRQVSETSALLEKVLADGALEHVSDAALQQLIASAVKLYSAKLEAGEPFPPFAREGDVRASDVVVMASQLLKASNLEVFELGLWQSWAGR